MGEAAGDSGQSPVPDKNRSTPVLAKAYMSPLAWALFVLPAILGLIADQWLKQWAFPDGVPADSQLMRIAGRNPGFHQPWPIVPNVLGLTTTINQGAVFGIMQGNVGLFLAFSVIALVVIVWVFVTSDARHRVVHFALGLITAGAMGNMYDRAMLHGVRDMLKFQCFVIGGIDRYPYVFNIADVLLCIGVPLLIVRWMFVKDEVPKSSIAS